MELQAKKSSYKSAIIFNGVGNNAGNNGFNISKPTFSFVKPHLKSSKGKRCEAQEQYEA